MATVDSTASRHVSAVGGWDLEADVVVVGLGSAGACAAIEATEAGADVLVLEATGAGGGLSAMSGGLVYLGGGTPIQEACGFEDSPDNMFAFLREATGPSPDEAKLRVFCDDAVAHYHWLVDHGMPFHPGFSPEPGLEAPTEDALCYSGGEDAWPFDRIATPAPRAHKPKVAGKGGPFLMECLLGAVARTPTRVEYDSRARHLVVDDARRVVGLVARREGRDVHVRARHGVILCSGGFVLNDDMVALHTPALARAALKLGAVDDGSGIRMAQAVGATTVRMDAAECALPITPPRKLVGGIIVNGSGQRFINEDTYYGRVGQEALLRQGGEAYLIVDEALYEVNAAGFQASWVCETAEELEAEIGLPDGSLVETLDSYNRGAAEGRDPRFHKHPDFLRPLQGPLGAYDLRVEHTIYAVFTLGGLHTTIDGEVLTPDGEAVAGLYAAGRTTSGLAAYGYASGLSLADCTYFGRRAGRRVADRP
ncbi:MAG: FAD-dependent oxidoreductase [Acidimicrobiales bacterium]|nr:FAD-dependent oxidoreductase [Acidimicrobiales bacterium]